MKASDKVYVFGGNHHNTLGVIRSLGQKGISSVLLLVDDNTKRSHYVGKSRYLSEKYLFTSCRDAVEFLMNQERDDGKDVIICCSDSASSAVDMEYDTLSKSYYIPNCLMQGEITRLMSKEVLAEEAKKYGLNVPQTWLSYYGTIPDGITFPCIIKPLFSKDGSKNDISVCNNLEELTQYFDNEHCDALQIQAFIVKDFEYQLIGCSISGGNEIVIPGVSKVIRPSKTSNTGFLYYDSLDDSYPIDEVKRMLKGMHYSGLFSAEFLRDKNGKDYFMEVNFRNDGNAISVTAAGVNLPYIWYCSAKGASNIPINEEIHPVYVMPEFDDLVHVFHHNITFKTWLKDMKRADCYMEFDKHDLKPYLYRVRDFWCLLINKMFRR